MSEGVKALICIVLGLGVPGLSVIVWMAHRKRLDAITEKLGRPGDWRKKPGSSS